MKPDAYVVVTHDKTGAVVKRLGPMNDRKAERVLQGILINLDLSNYTAGITYE